MQEPLGNARGAGSSRFGESRTAPRQLTAEHPSFDLTSDCVADEYLSRVRAYQHRATGATIISVSNSDAVLGFDLAFRTSPKDSSGVFHLLEHFICYSGSPDFPGRNGYTAMANGASALFLPAGTYPDHTRYGIFTKNIAERDAGARFWLDSAFFPNLNRTELEIQRGHFTANDAGEIGFSGVVYNEMGSRSLESNRVASRLKAGALMPGSVYAHNSGGDPTQIRAVGFDKIIEAHRQYYVAANSCMVFWGNDNELGRLNLAAGVLDKIAERGEAAQIVRPHTLPTVDRIFPFPAPPGPIHDRSVLTNLIWSHPDENFDPGRKVALLVLSGIFGAGEQSPIQVALRRANTPFFLSGCRSECAGTTRLFELEFANSTEAEREACRDMALGALRTIVREGLDSEFVRGVIQNITYAYRSEIESPTRALTASGNMLFRWVVGDDPVGALTVESYLRALNEQIERGERPIETLIADCLLGERQPSLITLVPDAAIAPATLAHEQALVDAAGVVLEIPEVQAHAARIEALALEGPTSQQYAKFPRPTVRDLEREDAPVPCVLSECDGATVLRHDGPPGMRYIDLRFDARDLPRHLVPYLKPLQVALKTFGTGTESPREFGQRVNLNCGGISVGHNVLRALSGNVALHGVTIGGRAHVGHTAGLMGLLGDVCAETNLDHPELLREWTTREIKNYAYAATDTNALGNLIVPRLLSGYEPGLALSARTLAGPAYRDFLKQLAHDIEHDWVGVVETLREVREVVLGRRRLHVNLSASGPTSELLEEKLPALLTRIPRGQAPQDFEAQILTPRREGIVVAERIRFGEAYDLGPEARSLGWALHVACSVLSTQFLDPQIRERLNAYGAEAVGHSVRGVIVMDAWDTPRVREAIDIMRSAGKFLRTGPITQADVDHAILTVISRRDQSLSLPAIAAEQFDLYLEGFDRVALNRSRAQILDCKIETIRQIGELLDQAISRQQQSIVVLAPADTLGSLKQWDLEVQDW